jgi:hypothetical protein
MDERPEGDHSTIDLKPESGGRGHGCCCCTSDRFIFTGKRLRCDHRAEHFLLHNAHFVAASGEQSGQVIKLLLQFRRFGPFPPRISVAIYAWAIWTYCSIFSCDDQGKLVEKNTVAEDWLSPLVQ